MTTYSKEKANPEKEHPELKDINNICDVAPKTKQTKEICERINEEKKDKCSDKS